MSNRESKTGESLIEPLTRREREVLTLLAQGYSGPEIAQKLTLALSSVKWHIQQLYGKLGVNSKQRAILRAGELGVLETISPPASPPERQPSASPQPAVTVQPGPKHNLPLQLTSFIGRENEMTQVEQLLSVGRLVTLTGTGGVGKTRLSLRAAEAGLTHFPDGVCLVELAPLSDPALVPQQVAASLGLRDDPARSLLNMLILHLRQRQFLLVLDNCEHVIEACARLTDSLLQACPRLRVLASSREPLGIAGELVFRVPSLSFPDPDDLPSIASLEDYLAVRLLVERTRQVLPAYQITQHNAAALARICQRLDGIPLALELAAARLNTLTAEQLASRLDDAFSLLTGGSRSALPRLQTLRAAIDWSYNLLSDDERLLLQRLSVFAGGCTLEVAEAVCSEEGLEAGRILDGLASLAAKSMLLADRRPGSETRYRMLETIRQYASERLLESGDSEQMRKRHLEFFLQWAERAELEVRGPRQIEWLDQLEAEHDNLRAALEWSLAQAERGEDSLRLAGALLSFWSQRGHISEGRAWLARALASPAAPTGAARAKALHAAGYLAREQGDTTTARALLEDSSGLWRALGSAGQTGLAQALATLADAMRQLGDPVTARSIAGEAIALCREQGERWGLAYSLSILGMAIRDQDDYALARSFIHESVALWRDIGDQWGLRNATRRIGEVALRQGDYEVALRHFADCLATARTLGDEDGVAEAFLNLGIATLNLGDRIQAKSFFDEGFSWFRESGDKSGIAVSFYYFGYLAQFEGDNQQAKNFFEQELALARTTGPIWLGSQALGGLAGVAAAGGQALRAARLLGASYARAEAGATYDDAADALFNGRTSSSATALLGEAAFAAALAEGRAMTFEQAADYALEEGNDERWGKQF